jgi:hypothetical protein
MSDLRPPLSAENYRNNIETKRSVFYLMSCEKISGGPAHSGFFGSGDDRFGRPEGFVRSGFHLDKDDGPLAIDHNQINFSAPAGKVTGEFLKTFRFEKALAAFLAPSAELFSVSQELTPIQQQTNHKLIIGRLKKALKKPAENNNYFRSSSTVTRLPGF